VRRRGRGEVLVPEALPALLLRIRRDQEGLNRARAESRRQERLLVRRPGPPVEVELHRVRAEEQRATEVRPPS